MQSSDQTSIDPRNRPRDAVHPRYRSWKFVQPHSQATPGCGVAATCDRRPWSHQMTGRPRRASWGLARAELAGWPIGPIQARELTKKSRASHWFLNHLT
jgi:hypothetical protein